MSELKAVTLQEENTGINLHDCGSDNDSSEVTPKVCDNGKKKTHQTAPKRKSFVLQRTPSGE